MNSPQGYYQFQITKSVKWLIITNLAIWLVLQLIIEQYVMGGAAGSMAISRLFALYPGKVVMDFMFWQPLTYMFMHSMNVSHLVLNMMMLWFIGTELEQRWGSRFFLAYYLISGFGAGLIYCFGMAVYFLVTGSQQGLMVPVIGASGAIFGLLLAYGILFGERILHFMMIFPMKAKYFVMILGAVEIVSMLAAGASGGGGDVAYLAHLGGLASGYLTLLGWTALQRRQWLKKSNKKKSGNLRLVVDNEKPDPRKDGPKYWN